MWESHWQSRMRLVVSTQPPCSRQNLPLQSLTPRSPRHAVEARHTIGLPAQVLYDMGPEWVRSITNRGTL